VLEPFREGAVVRAGVVLDPLGGRTWTSLPAERRVAHYDLLAAAYDRVVSGRLYNRWAWGIARERYGEVIDAALAAAGDGILLDAGAGSALFSAPAYASRRVRAVLFDLSLGMLRRADARLPPDAPVQLVQGDLRDLPFADAAFDAVLHFGIPHVLPELGPVVRELGRVVRPGGEVHVGSLVRTGRRAGDALLRVLQAAGEVAPARTADELAQALAPIGEVAMRQEGSWAFAVVTRA
jgi:SAM-dependent methyltransferase